MIFYTKLRGEDSKYLILNDGVSEYKDLVISPEAPANGLHVHRSAIDAELAERKYALAKEKSAQRAAMLQYAQVFAKATESVFIEGSRGDNSYTVTQYGKTAYVHANDLANVKIRFENETAIYTLDTAPCNAHFEGVIYCFAYYMSQYKA